MTKVISLVFTVLIFTPSLLVADTIIEQANALSKQFKIAHNSGKYSEIKKLIYFKGADQKSIKLTNWFINIKLKLKIKRSYITELPMDYDASYMSGDQLYRTTLKPVGILKVEYEKNSEGATGTEYPIGEIDGKHLITIGAPVK